MIHPNLRPEYAQIPPDFMPCNTDHEWDRKFRVMADKKVVKDSFTPEMIEEVSKEMMDALEDQIARRHKVDLDREVSEELMNELKDRIMRRHKVDLDRVDLQREEIPRHSSIRTW
jgi:hypothetical protein